MAFGTYIRERREGLLADGGGFGLRSLAGRIGIVPGYLSRIERELVPPPGEQTIKALAEELGEDPDLLLALAGKVSSDVAQVILDRPTLIASLIRTLARVPDKSVRTILKYLNEHAP